MDIANINFEKVIRLNRLAWENIPIHHMYPDINLIRCQKYLFPESKNKKILSIGFGEAEDLSYLAAQGFECYGIEISKKRLKFAKEKLKKRNQKAVLKLVDSSRLPFDDDFFDIVVAWESLCYNTEKTLTESLNEIQRVLRPDGKFLSSMTSVKQKFLCSKKIAPHTYRPAPETGQQDCIVYCLENRGQIKRIYKKFKNIKIGYYSSYLFKSHKFLYVIYCEKHKTVKL